MSFFGIPIRNGVAIGLGSVIALGVVHTPPIVVTGNLLTEIGNNLVQEDGGLILLE
jgi:hypothetical protein